MEELGSSWNYQEDFDELNLKLQYTIMELENVKMDAIEQTRKHNEETKHLLNLLELAYKERDEAKNQLQNLINKLVPNSQFENPIFLTPKPNSTSITESNSLSDPYHHHNNHNHGDSFIDTVTSPDFSTIKMGFLNQTNVPSITTVDGLTKGKILPQKGKLLQAVMEAGPLLQTLLVAGPLPNWRNPPPPLQALKFPTVSANGGTKLASQDNPNRADMVQKRFNHCSPSVLNFVSSGFSGSQVLNTSGAVKRQKVTMT
ncbi:hypothetical protein E1A91_D13G273600v1 [Gossypium mustelinum]|uniref:Uncharacterized protein n=3 Tax=Gossypium TaxID=3633 RepID=A0A5J5NS63_GOSBA|nr:hypothetical protein ES319_D13G267500v1 [Gossypium barbadense]TYG39139.1 hypothetical protein ES288_D13G280500v1 [Gossypium darwinii]TYI48810.1 hypothetical protein E1A91_D13G273600v1 [Gossypium mustelinum]